MNFKFHFMKYRHVMYIISAIMIAASIFSLSTRGLNYGIDFAGGISIEAKPTNADMTMDKMRSILAKYSPELQSVEQTGTVLIKIGLDVGADEAAQNQMVKEIKSSLGDSVEYRQVQIVGPKIGGELIRGGILAIIFAFLGMSLYIWVRYSGGYAFGALASMAHDFILLFGFFSVLGLEFNLTSIAVILMGIGYSVNDKVVNYDRIQENAKKYHKMDVIELVDKSINEMLVRTILTSVSTFLAVLALYFFGGAALRTFSLAMMFSIVLGTITSIFISNSLLINFDIRKGEE